MNVDEVGWENAEKPKARKNNEEKVKHNPKPERWLEIPVIDEICFISSLVPLLVALGRLSVYVPCSLFFDWRWRRHWYQGLAVVFSATSLGHPSSNSAAISCLYGGIVGPTEHDTTHDCLCNIYVIHWHLDQLRG